MFNFKWNIVKNYYIIGRCARAGRKGHAFNLVTTDEICYLLDLHLFLGRPLNMATVGSKQNDSSDTCFGKIPQFLLEEELVTLLNWSDVVADVVNIFSCIYFSYYA